MGPRLHTDVPYHYRIRYTLYSILYRYSTVLAEKRDEFFRATKHANAD